MRIPMFLTACLLAVPAAAQTGGYAGQQDREIKALSAQETADLLAGRGMGLARAAELNQYPGPSHVLELREKLGLSPDQARAVQASFDRMAAAAKPLGAELVAREQALDDAFKARAIEAAGLAAQTEAMGALLGRIRAVHLTAHLDMRAVLSPAQVAAYNTLRGYGVGNAPAPAHGGHGQRMHPG